jgi:hypothetical protein
MEALQQCGAFSLLNTSKPPCAMRYILFFFARCCQ